MPRVLAIVEGHTEASFFKISHPKCRVITPFPNGTTVSIAKIAEKIEFSIRTVGKEYDHIIVWLDRERRASSFSQIKSELNQRLSTLCPGRVFHIGVSDIQIENWILADEQFISDKFNKQDYKYCGDGKSAKKRLSVVSDGESFSPLSKAELLKSCYASRISMNSDSFSDFRLGIDIDWHWMKR